MNPALTKEALRQAREIAITSARRIHRRVSPQRGIPAVASEPEKSKDG